MVIAAASGPGSMIGDPPSARRAADDVGSAADGAAG
jgi:hypothetical protein